MKTQHFKVIKLENQGLEEKTAYYLRLDQEGYPPVNISIGETNYNKIKAMTDENTEPANTTTKKVENPTKIR